MMIATLVENIAKCLARFPVPESGAAKSPPHALFLGSEDNAALLHSFFTAEGWLFKHVPFPPGTDPNSLLPHADATYSLVICAPLGEQEERLWLERLRSTLSPSGILLCAFPAAGSSQQTPAGPVPFHKKLNTLASHARLTLADSWVDNRGPWHELVGIFQRNDAIARQPVQDVKLYPQATLSPGSATPPADTNVEPHDVVRPGIGYQQVLKELHAQLRPKLYAEIGIREGSSLRLAQGEAIAIDPFPLNFARNPQWKIYECGSDVFFDDHAATALDRPVDLAFIDGMHLFEYALRDFMNLERHASRQGAIAFDDVFPNHPVQAARVRRSVVWTGDIWKIVPCLRQYRPDLKLTLVDCNPTGLLVVSGLDPDNSVLWDRYGEIIDAFVVKGADMAPPADIVERAGAIDARAGLPPLAAPNRPGGTSPTPQAGTMSAATGHDDGRKRLSIIVVCYNMPREIPRTIQSLSARLQHGMQEDEYEIILVDNGSTQPFDEDLCRRHAGNLRVLRIESASPSPVAAINRAIDEAEGDFVGVMIDGARMASPGLLRHAMLASRMDKRVIVSTLGFHLGPDIQTKSVAAGYNQDEEDRLLKEIRWEEDPYRLFGISSFAGGSLRGWFGGISESNALFMPKALWHELGGMDPAFTSPGGGLVNLDTYTRALTLPDTILVVLLGEGSFHQVHGGIATNATRDPWKSFHAEYMSIRRKSYAVPEASPVYLGSLPKQVMPKIAASIAMEGYGQPAAAKRKQGILKRLFTH